MTEADPHNAKSRSMRSPGLGWRGGVLQLFLVTILPLTGLLLVIALASVRAHQQAMRAMVGERDERAVRTAAAALGAELERRITSIQDLAARAASQPPPALDSQLDWAQPFARDFPAGLAFFDAQGRLLAAVGDRAVWQAPANPQPWRATHPDQVHVSDAFPHPTGNGLLVTISSYTAPASAGEIALVAGALSPGELADGVLSPAFSGSEHSTVILADASGQLLYKNSALPLAGRLQDHTGITQALAGNTGANFLSTTAGEHVAAYTPVAHANWALVIEEPWEMVASPILSYTQVAPLVLVPALLFALFALWFGVRKIVQPLQALEERADALAWGEYQSIQSPVGGIAEIRRLQAGLVDMARKVQSAQQSLHGYIGAITAGQEDERRRLARELHDDTIQALIALKQRVQLAQLKPSDSSAARSFAEVEDLTEKTIANLRRVTRALRPIYLEDLGLRAALEMLAREVSQASGVPVEFTSTGPEQRLPPQTELALYRIAQEALSNVTRHAQAAHAAVQIAFTPEMVVLEVTDDGQGFTAPGSPAEFAPGGHYGLLGMHERAELIGARLSLESRAGQGTRVLVQTPTQTAAGP